MNSSEILALLSAHEKIFPTISRKAILLDDMRVIVRNMGPYSQYSQSDLTRMSREVSTDFTNYFHRRSQLKDEYQSAIMNELEASIKDNKRSNSNGSDGNTNNSHDNATSSTNRNNGSSNSRNLYSKIIITMSLLLFGALVISIFVSLAFFQLGYI